MCPRIQACNPTASISIAFPFRFKIFCGSSDCGSSSCLVYIALAEFELSADLLLPTSCIARSRREFAAKFSTHANRALPVPGVSTDRVCAIWRRLRLRCSASRPLFCFLMYIKYMRGDIRAPRWRTCAAPISSDTESRPMNMSFTCPLLASVCRFVYSLFLYSCE